MYTTASLGQCPVQLGSQNLPLVTWIPADHPTQCLLCWSHLEGPLRVCKITHFQLSSLCSHGTTFSTLCKCSLFLLGPTGFALLPKVPPASLSLKTFFQWKQKAASRSLLLAFSCKAWRVCEGQIMAEAAPGYSLCKSCLDSLVSHLGCVWVGAT